MLNKPEYPEFSNIRSHLQRVEAQRNFEIGYALADALVDAGDFLRRGLSALISPLQVIFSRRARR
jgi:hypothetical protein